MKIIGKTVIPIFWATILTACNVVTPTTTMSETNIMGTAMSIAKTEVVMTLTAVPTATFPPPTPIPPIPTSIPRDAYADKIDYAKTTADKIITLLPYIRQNPFMVNSGCVETNDFQSLVTDTISNETMDTVNTAFVKYFESEGWEFTEATHEMVGRDNNQPRISYDVYRISSMDVPTFERLTVIFYSTPITLEWTEIYVRVIFTHIETKENFEYISNIIGMCHNSW